MKTNSELLPPEVAVTRALVREVPAGFGRQNGLSATPTRVDVGRAREQHAAFVQALRSAGVGVINVAADDTRAESAWVADVVVLVGRRQAILCRPSSLSRIDEAESFSSVLGTERTWHETPPGATLEGGDVLAVGDTLFVGLSERTNEEGAALLESVARLEHLKVVRMQVKGALRLRSVCAYLGGGVMIHAAGAVARDAFPGLQHEPAPEAQGASLLVGPEWAILPEEAPRTANLLERRGIRPILVPMSEFLKRHGGPSRLCIAW